MEKFGKPGCVPQPVSAEGCKQEHKFEIGGATYLVTAHYQERGGTTALDRVARLIDRDTATA